MPPAENKVTRLPFVGAQGNQCILLVKMTGDCVKRRFRGFNGDAGRQTHHGEELTGIALMQHVIRELRSKGSRGCDGNEQLSGIDGKRAIEILWGDSDDGRRLSVQAKRLSHRIRRGIETIAPETITDYYNGRVARFIKFGGEHSSLLRSDAEHGEIIGGYKLSKDALRRRIYITLKSDIERDAGLECSDAAE
jgi:hypothetical protein